MDRLLLVKEIIQRGTPDRDPDPDECTPDRDRDPDPDEFNGPGYIEVDPSVLMGRYRR